MLYLDEIKLALILLSVVLLYHLFIKPRLEAAKAKLLERFHRTQSLSIQLQDMLSGYILRHDAMNKEFTEGVTYKMYLRGLQKQHTLNLSEKLYKKLKNLNVVLFYSRITTLLNKQEKRLAIVKQELAHLGKVPAQRREMVSN